MASLKSMVPSLCRVIRDGKVRRIPAAELVVGDLVQLKGGDRVRGAKLLAVFVRRCNLQGFETAEFRMPSGTHPWTCGGVQADAGLASLGKCSKMGHQAVSTRLLLGPESASEGARGPADDPDQRAQDRVQLANWRAEYPSSRDAEEYNSIPIGACRMDTFCQTDRD